MPTTCEISFEKPERVFYAGQLLSGTVRLTLTKEKKVRGVYVHIFGRAYAYWTKYCNVNHDRNSSNNNSSSNSGHHVSYTGSEDYLDEKTYFVGSSSGEMKLAPGTHNYNFQCMLPPGLPTSVENDVGHIAYGANVVLNIPWWSDKEFKEYFTVIKPINLNVDPSFRMPATGNQERVFYPLGCCCCCPSGPLKMDAKTPVRGYTPGQTINVTVKVSNESNEDVGSFDVGLVKEITFYGHGVHDGRYESDTKTVDHVITGEELRGCPIGQKDNFYVNLRVPSIPPTDYATSNVVHVKYYVRVTGVLSSCCTSNEVLNLPITIGTYPILDADTIGLNSHSEPVITMQPTAPQMPQMPNETSPLVHPTFPSLPTAPIAPSAPLDPYPSEDPPTYEEVLASASGGSNNFKPKYPMFRRQTSYSIDKS